MRFVRMFGSILEIDVRQRLLVAVPHATTSAAKGLPPASASAGSLVCSNGPESVRLAVAKIKILVGIVQKNVVVIDADGLAKTRLVAHLAADALGIGSRREYQGGGQCAGGSRHDRDCTHGL